MPPRNTTKLITGFLLVAILVASGGFILTNWYEARNMDWILQTTDSESPQVPASAFVENLTGEPAEPVSASRDVAEPNSMTDRFAKIIAEQIQAQNPEGPTKTEGVFGVQVPDLDAAVARFTEDPRVLAEAQKSAQVPLPVIPHQEVIEQFTEDDVVRYAQDFKNILGENILSPEIFRTLDEAPTADAANTILQALGLSAKKLSALRVPEPFAELHLAAVKALIYSRDLASIDEAAIDPLGSALAYSVREERARVAVEQFDDQVGRVRISHPSAMGDTAPDLAGFFREMFGVKTAHAQGIIPVECAGKVCLYMLAQLSGTAKNTVLSLGQKILNYLKILLTEFLKDILIHRLVQQTIQWIQGGGKPQFVTDWKGFLGDAANTAAGNALFRIDPQLCSSFGPLVQVALQPIDLSANKPVMCTLTQIVGNVKAFADDFTNGGWIAYGAALEPQNNYFGALIQVNSMWQRTGRTAVNAQKNDAEAAGGWLSTRICVNYETRMTGPLGALTPTKVCTKYENTTPGNALGHAIYDAMGAPVHRIVNADDVSALVSALLNAGLTKLINLVKGDPGYPHETPGIAGLPVSTIGSGPASAPDISPCRSIVDPDQRDACIAQICQLSGWTLPPCGVPTPLPTPTPPPTPGTWVPATCLGPGQFIGCTLSPPSVCDDFGNPTYSTWSPSLGLICQTACGLPNPNSYCP